MKSINILLSLCFGLTLSTQGGLDEQEKQQIIAAILATQAQRTSGIGVSQVKIKKKKPQLTIEIPPIKKTSIPTPEPLSPKSHEDMVQWLFLNKWNAKNQETTNKK